VSKKDRERAEATGIQFRNGDLVPAKEAGRVVTDKERARMEKVGVSAIESAPTSSQVKIMSEALRTGRLSHPELRKALEQNTPDEMRRGVDKLVKKGKPVTVDALLAEYWGDTQFQELASDVGLDEQYFIKLAEIEINRRGQGGKDETGKKGKRRLRIFG